MHDSISAALLYALPVSLLALYANRIRHISAFSSNSRCVVSGTKSSSNCTIALKSRLGMNA